MANSYVFLISLAFVAQQMFILPASAQCNKSNFTGFANCVDLQPSSLAWTYFEINSTVSIAYTDTALSTSGWVGWGVNFNGTSMVGSNALIAFNEQNGSTNVLRYKLTSSVYNNPSLPLNPVGSFDQLQVINLSTVISGTSFTIFGTLQLPSGKTSINSVYNRGPSVTNDIPAPHNTGQRNGMRTIDMTTGEVIASQAPHQKLKNLHGILAIASWGVLLILGAMTARYLRPFADPAWFYIHILLQVSAYLLGVSAWAIGLELGTLSPGIVYHSHRNFGIAIFCLATVQMFALFARPHKEHKIRLYWNIYHHALGYTVIILGVINIFKGFNILAPPHKYKAMYIAFIVLAACASLGLEALTWAHFFRQRREKQAQHIDETNVTRHTNGNRRTGTQMYAATGPPKWDNEV